MIRLLTISLHQGGAQGLEGFSSLWPPLPGKAVKPFLSISLQTLSPKCNPMPVYTEAEIWHQWHLEFFYRAWYFGASQVVLTVKNVSANAVDLRDTGSVPELGRSSGEGHGNPLQYSWLENLMDRGAWWAIQSIELQRVGHNWTSLAFFNLEQLPGLGLSQHLLYFLKYRLIILFV